MDFLADQDLTTSTQSDSFDVDMHPSNIGLHALVNSPQIVSLQTRWGYSDFNQNFTC